MSEKPYDLIVIGGGAAGLTAAGFMGKAGGRVALIERRLLGGDCTWFGCVPSKALLKVSKIAHNMRTASKYGIASTEPQIDMHVVRQYVKSAIDEIYQHETPDVFGSKYNVEVILGEARFVNPTTINVGDRTLEASKYIIATGGRPTIPSVDGLDSVPYLTNETLFDNDRLPGHLLIMGAGPIGVEMGQAYARLGAKVTIMDVSLLPRDEPEVRDLVRRLFVDEGIEFVPSLVKSVVQREQSIIAHLENGDTVQGDMLLVAVGRTPNTDLGLENAGVAYSQAGIPVDDYLRTNVKHIYAIGDCTQGPKFTHYAGFQGSIAGRNAALPVVNSKGKVKYVPWVTYTDPEIAHAGMTEAQAREKYGKRVKVSVFSLREGDRTVVENDQDGFIKLIYTGGGNLIGATVVSERAGEMIFELQLAINNKLSLREITSMIHPYPSYMDVVKKAVSSVVIDELFKGVSGRAIKLLGRVLYS
ncbi:MAG: dihydrolipoyl dehydrogenase family protein [Chloroflexota bacterium]